MKTDISPSHPLGFTLREIVTSLGVMTLGLSILVPALALQRDLRQDHDREMARQIVVFYETAKHQGVDFLVDGAPIPTVVKMTNGQPAQNGAMLRLQGISADEIKAALPHLKVKAGTLTLANEASEVLATEVPFSLPSKPQI